MGRSLQGKWALVSGSTRGLGRSIAEALAEEGASIGVSGRDADAVQLSVDAIKQIGVGSIGIAADLALVADAHRLAAETLAAVPQLDILINNAGMSIRSNFWEVTDDEWDTQVNVNYRSPFIIAQYAAKHMIKHGVLGRIVNLSTIGARACHTNAAVYNSAKGAVETMTRNMAYELGSHGITVNCVVPGVIAERPGTEPAEWWDKARKRIPVGRVGRSQDVAAAALFFCLPGSDFITGQSLLVDGGHDTYLPEF